METISAAGPPHRSVRALLTHRAPGLDSGFKAKLGIRMKNARRRQPRLVAVGTVIADRRPHRSVRALLTHTAPTLDSGCKAKLGIRMQHAWRRQPSLGSLVHPVYAKPPGLTAPSQRMPPVSTYSFPEQRKCLQVTWHCVILWFMGRPDLHLTKNPIQSSLRRHSLSLSAWNRKDRQCQEYCYLLP